MNKITNELELINYLITVENLHNIEFRLDTWSFENKTGITITFKDNYKDSYFEELSERIKGISTATEHMFEFYTPPVHPEWTKHTYAMLTLWFDKNN